MARKKGLGISGQPTTILGNTPFNQRLDFLRESIRNLRATGSVAPSSRFLCRTIASKIDPTHASVVVELGPGDGVITRFILNRLKPGARLVIFEINDAFVGKIRTTFDDPRLVVIHDSAENMGRYFKEMGIESVDYFVSGIPFVMLPESLAESITTKCRHWLRAGGRFIQFHYSPLLISFYRRIFGNVDVDVVALNIPPAIVISCEKNVIKVVMPFRFIFLIFIALGVVSCEQNFLFEEKKEIPGGVWMYRDTVDFKFTVTDTSTLYNLFVDFEHADTFPNQNIYLKLYTRFPDGKRLSMARSFDLFNLQGESNGECSGGVCRVHILLQDRAYFNRPGEYVITLEQFTRRDALPGIRAVGMAIEKKGKKGEEG